MLILLSPVAILLATLCMQWVDLGTFGAFSVKLPYATLALVVALTFVSGKRIRNSFSAFRRYAYWIVPFILYLILMGLVQAGTPAANSAPRQAFYLIGAIALAGSLASTRQLSRTLRFGAAAGIGLLIVAIELLARRIGLSWWDAVVRFFEGDFKFVVYSFFREIFNSIGSQGEEMGAATKNEVAVGVLVLALLFRTASPKPAKDLVGMVGMGVALGLLLLLNTRSVLIAAGLSLVVAIALGASVRPRGNLFPLLLKGAAALALILVAVSTALPNDGASSELSDRFAFDDQSTSARLDQYRAALDQIQLHPFTGNGYFEFDGYVIHNLFLNAWVQGGLAAFLFAVLFYGGLLVAWLSFLRMIVTRPHQWVLPIAPEWVAPLPIMPLFRMWSSGDGGHMFLGEWIAVGCFIGCVLANQLRVRALARYLARQRERAPAMPDPGFVRPAPQR